MTTARRQPILILGGAGMLGHKLLQVLQSKFAVHATFRSEKSLQSCLAAIPNIATANLIPGVEAFDFASVRRAFDATAPQVVINCIGIVKQNESMQEAIPSIQLNALFPHQLAQLCAERAVRLIHFSTDCVFSGRQGSYSEGDNPDPVDLYGRTKLVGEVDQPGCITLRSSIIGWELEHHRSLLGWFASQRGKRIVGYQGAIYSGLSTPEMGRLVADIIDQWPQLSGIYHVASAPISKYALLCGLRDALGWKDIDIAADTTFACNRSLAGDRFRQATGWTAPPWRLMIDELARERAQYDRGILQGSGI